VSRGDLNSEEYLLLLDTAFRELGPGLAEVNPAQFQRLLAYVEGTFMFQVRLLTHRSRRLLEEILRDHLPRN
jgi:hypothetical protein